MTLELNSMLGEGGIGMNGDGPGTFAAMVKELQGFNITVAAGASANTKINVAAIREEDTILSCLNNNAGTITDVTGTMSIASTKGSGTLTLSGVVADDTCVVNGKTYTFQAAAPTSYGQVQVGASDTASAANLSAAINSWEGSVDGADVVATSSAGVVTLTAVADGTVGNSVATVGSTHITASGATLTGGTATGGVKSTGATNQIILFWFNKQ